MAKDQFADALDRAEAHLKQRQRERQLSDAAPDLLAALKAMEAWITNSNTETREGRMAGRKALIAARAAIAKAEGQS